jgi:hypothetical protein
MHCGLRSGLRIERQKAKDRRRPPALARNTSARRLPQFACPDWRPRLGYSTGEVSGLHFWQGWSPLDLATADVS